MNEENKPLLEVVTSIKSVAVSPISNRLANVFPPPNKLLIFPIIVASPANPKAKEPMSDETNFSITSLSFINPSKASLIKSDLANVVIIDVHISFNLFNLPAILSIY